MLTIKNLYVETAGKPVLRGINLTIKPGEIHAIMGPNGAGKTSLAMAMAGHPGYKLSREAGSRSAGKVESGKLSSKGGSASGGKVQLDGKDLSSLKPEERARKGLFIAFQNPIEVTGVSVLSFLRTAGKSLHPQKKVPLSEFKKEVLQALEAVRLGEDFMQRSLNEGFSGGEKKRMEMAQLLILKPKYAILDEIDSGLDVDSLKIVAQAVNGLVKKHKTGLILITHYSRILHFIKPNAVHVLIDGKIKASNGMSLVKKIEEKGYGAV